MWWAGPRKHFVVAKKIQQNHMRRQIGGAREWGGNINIKYARNQFIMLAISKREQLGKKVIQKQAATKAPKATKNVHKVLCHTTYQLTSYRFAWFLPFQSKYSPKIIQAILYNDTFNVWLKVWASILYLCKIQEAVSLKVSRWSCDQNWVKLHAHRSYFS